MGELLDFLDGEESVIIGNAVHSNSADGIMLVAGDVEIEVESASIS